jgi:adenosylcobyric acid synthase
VSARTLMILGTSSHVGKSLLTAALCRIFARRGYRVAPFKSQNMSLNSAATVEGLEIGRAQALQAEAAGVPASVHMNPILIKPSGNSYSQIVVRGRIWGRLSASEYHQQRVRELLPIVQESFARLAGVNELLILEGAGSPAEINLKAHDIVNMRIAEMADATCILIGDIDRGGVFASLLGTLELLEPEERRRIKGFVINKFRGDLQLLLPGIRMIESRLGIRCLGVIPYLDRITLEEEDSVGLEAVRPVHWISDSSSTRELRVAVICFPSLSNFTDFDVLRSESSVSLAFCKTAEELQYADVIILPGSKQTVQDLRWMRSTGIADALKVHTGLGRLTVGICGGMQMLGKEISDPEDVETGGREVGLGILPIRTSMRTSKITVTAKGNLFHGSLFGQALRTRGIEGYEIHVGETTYLSGAEPFANISRALNPGISITDGCVSADGRTVGTYLHGVFDQDGFRHEFLQAARAAVGLAPAGGLRIWKCERERQWQLLADEVERALDLSTICSWLHLPNFSRREPSCVPVS